MKKKRSTKQSFIQGTLILLAAGIINRILGFIPRITLPRIIGAEGVGIYQLGYPFLLVVITLITGGIPLAVAKLVAEADAISDHRRSKQILNNSLLFSVTAGILLSGLCLILAPWITSYILTDKRVYYTFMMMTPIIVLVSISSVLRGYFQGKQNMIPTAASQVAETVIRIITMIGCAYLFLPYGLEWAAAGAMLGVVIGELAGLLVLWLELRASRRSEAQDAPHPNPYSDQAMQEAESMEQPKEWRNLFKIAIPVTGGKLIGSLSYLLESIAIARSLAIAGVTTAVATAQYGILQGMIIPVLTLPGALTYSLAVSLVPSLSEAYGRKDMQTIRKRLHQAIRLALVSGAPFAVIMFVLAVPLCAILYNDPSVGTMLRWMAPVAIFIYIQAPLQAALQALDRPGTALTNTLIGAVLKLGLIIQLASIPALGIKGAVIAISINIVIVTSLHAYMITRSLKLKLPWMDILKVITAMIIMAAVTQYAYIHAPWGDIHMVFRFIAASMLGALTYTGLLIFMKLVDRSDMARMPVIGRWFHDKAA
ncbi:stage V sporulation protein B [Paenibacillus aquistagni]|uniref:Stage V sporulation protein B n=1 Tax=Paenibacillus aquistagni TaxID=1852522 RepID=A0A1X7I2P4_9BACL|nr:stage V sporulation protein B [Paenibacillus aquistagni]SMG08472.1 stage V sporulation protein B [Paenibacillus aquistagni]